MEIRRVCGISGEVIGRLPGNSGGVFSKSKNLGSITNADDHSAFRSPCEDTIEIWLRIADGIINYAKFETDGCMDTILTGSMVTEIAEGKTVNDALIIRREEIVKKTIGRIMNSIALSNSGKIRIYQLINEKWNNRH